MSIKRLSILVDVALTTGPNAPSALWWTAQCIEHDLATQAKSLDGLMRAIPEMIMARIELCTKHAIDPWYVSPAPTEVCAMFEASYLRLELLPGAWLASDLRRELPGTWPPSPSNPHQIELEIRLAA